MALVFDLETDGLLHEVSRLHCIVTQDSDDQVGKVWHDDPNIHRDGSLQDGLSLLASSEVLVGHNIIEYDLPVLAKLYGMKLTAKLHDTLAMSRLLFSDLKEQDFKAANKGVLLRHGAGNHSLRAWGERLKDPKIKFEGGFDSLTSEMVEYCLQDVSLTARLYQFFLGHGRGANLKAIEGTPALEWEMRFVDILHNQEMSGVCFDRGAADSLIRKLLDRKAQLESELMGIFPPDFEPHKPHKNGSPRMILCPYRGVKCPDKMIPFKPTSRKALADRLARDHEWVPKELTDKGNPSMVEDVLVELSTVYPQVVPFLENTVITARLGVLSDGPSSYSRLLRDGMIHGRTLHIGTVTHRCSHTKPNLGNVVAVNKPFGLEMRALFRPHPGFIQAGWDVDGLELRMLGHYLSPLDGGEYVRAVDSGRKEDGTDVHSLHARAISTVIPCSRDASKTCTYAYLYGAGDARLGATFGQGAALGKRIRAAIGRHVPGLDSLLSKIRSRFQTSGVLYVLDGRAIPVRRAYSALNSLLQASGAIVVRYMTIMFQDELARLGLVRGRHFIQTGHIHDEVQFSLKEDCKVQFESALSTVCSRVQTALDLRVPIKATPKFGENWAETH